MNRYFEELYSLLGQLSEEERADAVSYYKEFAMDMGIENRELLESSFGPAKVLAEKILSSEGSDESSVVVKEPAADAPQELQPAPAECTALIETVPQKEPEREEITAVQVKVTAVDVHIASGNDFSVEYDLPKGEEVEFCGVRNGCLIFETKKDGKEDWAIHGRGVCVRGDMTLYMPKKKLRSLFVETVSGDMEIEAESLKVPLESDEVKLKTISGDISTHGIKAVQVMLISTSGDVEFEGICKNITATSKSGDINIDGACTNVTAASNSGDVAANGAFVDIMATSLSGDINLDVKDSGTCRLESKSGDVELTGATLDEVQISTFSGDCTVNVDSCAQCNAKSISGDCNISGDMHRTEVTSVSGCVEVYGRVGRFWKLKTVSGDISLSAKNKVKIEMIGRRGFRRSFTQEEGGLPVVRIETVSGEVDF